MEKVAAGLQQCGIGRVQAASPQDVCEPLSLLLAVSGGIDSMVMLHALRALNTLPHPNAAEGGSLGSAIPIPTGFSGRLRLSVVTVNHNIRPASETEADALFVKEQCALWNIPCTVKTIPAGAVASAALSRGGGTEEAARFLRYALLQKQAEAEHCDFVLLAHNRDDQLETLLQRFFQGASAGISGFAAAGIAKRRGIFCRPLLDIPRCDIEEYARFFSVPFREDKTNGDPSYYRNNLRLHLIPLLNEHIRGWDTGVLSGAQKAEREALFIEELASLIEWECVPSLSGGASSRCACDAVRTASVPFFQAGFPVRIRALYKAAQKIGIERRIPYALFKDCASGKRRVRGCGIECVKTKKFLTVTNLRSGTTLCSSAPEEGAGGHSDFCISVAKAGSYEAPFGRFEVLYASEAHVRKTHKRADNKYGGVCAGPFSLPFTIRNRRAGDRIQTAQGTHKALKKIWNEWGIESRLSPLVPVIEYGENPVCIWGAPFGYPDWYVKGCAQNGDCVFLFYPTGRTLASAFEE
ncbi:tRNA lysidine(34) synthetase TilS [Treponema maltophilum]|uniref:tRNA lysidine(34) synthetase TilS n=1 Tax=Treponema maltophilum TaxID=51160 RepID=UPI003D932978